MGLFGSAEPYKGQKYSQLKKQAVSRGVLFEDPEFPPRSSSIYFSKSAPGNIVWKRPGEIVSDPKFFVDGASTDDFSQGEVGNCWFVAASACLAEKPELLKKIIPDMNEQDFGPDSKYAGIFHFTFYQCGKWIDVVIDDLLPTRNDSLMYLHSKTKNEFWSSLLEKAYAKLFGSYEALDGGLAKDALEDMTGGVGEMLELKDYKTEDDKLKLFKVLQNSIDYRSLLSASITASESEREAKLSCGLVKGHAYSITAVRDVKLGKGLLAFFKREKIHMIRLRNPWGDKEWNGAWSDGSEEWKNVSKGEQEALGLTIDDNGEFWMSFEDFCKYYTEVELCHMINTSFFSIEKTWREGKAIGEWRTLDRNGGCPNQNSFLDNPQYIFDITNETDEIMISLEQWDKRIDKDKGKDNDSIGIAVMKTDLNREYRMHDKMEIISSGPYSNSRSVFNRVELTQGRYCIIPSTFEPRKPGKFIIRIYCSSSPSFKELIDDEPPPPTCLCICKPIIAATQITIVRANNLPAQDRDKSSDPYFVLKCDGQKVKTRYWQDSLDPECDTRVTFYHKYPDKNIIIEVWNYNIIKDQFMGVATINMLTRGEYCDSQKMKEYDLYGKGKEAETKKQGCLWVAVFHTTDLRSV